jgi:hypothetical protein
MFDLDLVVDTQLLYACFQMFNVSLELVSLGFLDQDFLGVHDLDVILLFFALGVFIFDIEDTEKTILTC